jgi:hypothetical protein
MREGACITTTQINRENITVYRSEADLVRVLRQPPEGVGITVGASVGKGIAVGTGLSGVAVGTTEAGGGDVGLPVTIA